MGGKNREKHLAGQPVFGQIVEFVPRNRFGPLVGKHRQDRCALIAPLLLQVLGAESESKEAFSAIAPRVRIHPISHPGVLWMAENSRRAHTKRKTHNKSPRSTNRLVLKKRAGEGSLTERKYD